MKKILTLVFFVVILLAITKEADATATLYVGGTIGGKETVTDNDSINYYSGRLSNTVINYTYIKKIEFCVESQIGESGYYWRRGMTLGNIKIGYPVMDEKSTLVFVTVGYLNCKRNALDETGGYMLGADLVTVATDNFYVSMDFQYSLFGATYRRTYPLFLELPVAQLSVKMKAQYILTDHLGLVLNLHWMHFDVNDGFIVEDILTPSFGVIYRF